MQYQIDRCTAPCVAAISSEDYAKDVHYSALFLQGKSDELIRELTATMEACAAKEDFERAAVIRDQIKGLRRMQEQQVVANHGNDADVVAAEIQGVYVCVHVIYIRGGRIIGSKNFYPRFKLANNIAELLSAFLSQWYLRDDKAANIPAEIIVPEELEGAEGLAEALSYVAGRKIKLSMRVRGHRAKWLQLARTNARESLQAHVANKKNNHMRFKELKDILNLESIPSRVECFDISHTAGEGTVGSCVVFDESGPVKSDYRRFNVEGVVGGDDYAAMEQVLERRFTRLAKGEGKIPDVLLIDGGKGQLAQAQKVMEKFELPEVLLLGIAKGISRRAGQETLFLADSGRYREVAPPAESVALHLLQQIRDEAHRFAITGHRARRAKARKRSALEGIPGLGPKRRRELLRYFGGQQEINKASEAEIAKVTGISKRMAENIYAYLHSS